jgi:hypothetical protein
LVGIIYLVGFRLKSIDFVFGKKPPAAPIPMLGFLENVFFEPAKQGGPADANYATDLSGSIIDLPFYCNRHIKTSELLIMLEYTLTLKYAVPSVNNPLVMFWQFTRHTLVPNHTKFVLIVLPSGKSYNNPWKHQRFPKSR